MCSSCPCDAIQRHRTRSTLDQVISPEFGQDTSSCHNFRPRQKMPRNHQFDPFQSQKIAPVLPILRKSIYCDQNLISSEGDQDAPTRQISGRKCLEIPNLNFFTSQNGAKIRKKNRPWSIPNHFWRWSRYTSMPNFRPLLPWVVQNMPGGFEFDRFHYL